MYDDTDTPDDRDHALRGGVDRDRRPRTATDREPESTVHQSGDGRDRPRTAGDRDRQPRTAIDRDSEPTDREPAGTDRAGAGTGRVLPDGGTSDGRPSQAPSSSDPTETGRHDAAAVDDAGPAEGEVLLEVEDLTTHFFTEQGVVRAVDGISFDVRAGEIVGLVGESGAGKSVATASILRLVEAPGEIVGGEVSYMDTTIVGFEERGDGLVPRDDMLSEATMREEIRGSEIAIIFQDPMESLNPVYTVGEQVREFVELNRDLSGDAARREVIGTLREVGIPEPEERYDDYPHEFSGGMRQRVLIAMALACRPRLIIADEPTTALDVTVEGQILELVADLQAEYGTSFIWVTHDMGVIAEICDRVNVLYLGEIVERGPVRELFHDTHHPYTRTLLDSIPRPDEAVADLDPISGVMPEPIDPPRGCRFHTRCPDAREACREVDPRFVEVGADHHTACIKHDDLGYWESTPIANEEREPLEDEP